MITLNLKAGLGNQLFQYAYARALALRGKTNLRINLHWFSDINPNDTKRTFLLDKYNLPIADGSVQTVDLPSPSGFHRLLKKIKGKISRDIFGYSDYVYYPRLAKAIDFPTNSPVDIEIEGFWNTEKYFKDFEDTIRKELTLKDRLGEEATKTEQRLKEMSHSSSLICIHVRRGDYVSNADAQKHHGLRGLDYYAEAIKIMLDSLATTNSNLKPVFVLASDDIDWVKESIVPLLGDAQYEILSNTSRSAFENATIPTSINSSKIADYEELYLMSLCHHFIIANSSFSWWAAWLSKTASSGANADTDTGAEAGYEKIVIGPKKWVANSKIDTSDVMPEEWIRI